MVTPVLQGRFQKIQGRLWAHSLVSSWSQHLTVTGWRWPLTVWIVHEASYPHPGGGGHRGPRGPEDSVLSSPSMTWGHHGSFSLHCFSFPFIPALTHVPTCWHLHFLSSFLELIPSDIIPYPYRYDFKLHISFHSQLRQHLVGSLHKYFAFFFAVFFQTSN